MPDHEDFRPGADDLELPFLLVPHGAPDPVEWKRRHPGWVSFPATFVPHPRPIPRSKTINGQRWPLDKRGRPWSRTRYGHPTCPFDELPPGMPVPGTQHELLRKLEHPPLFWEEQPMSTVEEVLALGAQARAERAARPPRRPRSSGPGPMTATASGLHGTTWTRCGGWTCGCTSSPTPGGGTRRCGRRRWSRRIAPKRRTRTASCSCKLRPRRVRRLRTRPRKPQTRSTRMRTCSRPFRSDRGALNEELRWQVEARRNSPTSSTSPCSGSSGWRRTAAGLLGAAAARATVLGSVLWSSPTGDGTLSGTGLTLNDAPGLDRSAAEAITLSTPANETARLPSVVTVDLPPPREGETPANVLIPSDQPVGEKGGC